MAEQIKELGRGGLNTDVSPMLLPMNVFTDVMNVRFDDEAVQTITGERSYTLNDDSQHGLHWRTPDGGKNVYVSYDRPLTGVRVTSEDAQGNITDISPLVPAGFASDSGNVIQSCTFNGGYAVIINDGQNTPHYSLYGDAVSEANITPLPGWNYVSGTFVSCKVMRPLNYALVAANLTIKVDNGPSYDYTYAPGTIRISVQAATGSIPTIWQPGLTTDTADEFELSSTSPILDMLELRGNMFVYSQEEINILTIGASTRVSPYSKTYGILTTGCVCEYDGNHLVVGNGDIYTHNGSGNIQSLADWRIKKYFFDNLDTTFSKNVHVVKDSYNKEIWIAYPKKQDSYGNTTGFSGIDLQGKCTEALIYQYKNNTWTKRQLFPTNHLFTGPDNTATYPDFSAGSFDYTRTMVYMLCRAPVDSGTITNLITDNSYSMASLVNIPDYGPGPYSWPLTANYGTAPFFVPVKAYVEKKKLNTGDVTGSSLISAIYPMIDIAPVDANIDIRVTGQNNYIEDSDLSLTDQGSKDLFTFLPYNHQAQGYKVEPRTNGRLLNFRITGIGHWRLPTLSFDLRPADRR